MHIFGNDDITVLSQQIGDDDVTDPDGRLQGDFFDFLHGAENHILGDRSGEPDTGQGQFSAKHPDAAGDGAPWICQLLGDIGLSLWAEVSGYGENLCSFIFRFHLTSVRADDTGKYAFHSTNTSRSASVVSFSALTGS